MRPSARPSLVSVLAGVWVVLVTVAVLLAVTVTTADAADVTVRLTSHASPASVTVAVGDAVTVRNDDGARHRLRARDPEDVDTGNLEPGEEAVVTFPVVGRYVLVDARSEDPAYEVTVDVRGAGASGDGASGDGASGDGGGSPALPPSSAGGTGTGAPSSATVTIPDDVFSPASVTVATGGTVTWENRDGDHTVTARDGSWDSGTFDAGGRYERRFPEPGTYAYLCLLHSDMTGTVQVVGSGGSTSATPPSPSPTASPTASPAAAAPTPASASASASTPPEGTRHELRIADFAYAPASLAVAPGDTLVWVNGDEAPHTVTSSGGGPLASETLARGDRYEVVLEEVGTFAYLCALHPEMTGEVVVTDDAAALADTPAAAENGGSGAPAPGGAADTTRTAPARTAGSDGDGNLSLVAGIMLLFMGVTFTIGRVSAH